MSARQSQTSLAGVVALIYQRYNGLSLRERVLVTLSLLSVTWMV
jgi:hypothetical protein